MQGHQDRVVAVVTVQHRHMHVRVAMACEAHEAALTRLLGRLERFYGASRAENPVDFLHLPNSVDLPEVHIVRLESLEGEIQFLRRTFARAIRALGGDKDVLADLRQHLPKHLFRAPAPIAVGVVEVVDTQIVGAPGDGLGLFKRTQRKAPARLADHCQALAGATEYPSGHVAALASRRSRRNRGTGCAR